MVWGNVNITSVMDSNPTSGYISKEMKSPSGKDTCTPMFIANSQVMETT